MYFAHTALAVASFVVYVNGQGESDVPNEDNVQDDAPDTALVDDHTFVALIDIVFTDGTKRTCTGSIIHENVVITAAHCFKVLADPDVRPELTASFAVIGTKVMFDTGYKQYLPIERVITHPKYKGWTADLSLVYTFAGMISDKPGTIIPLAGEKTSTHVDSNVTVLSWGHITRNLDAISSFEQTHPATQHVHDGDEPCYSGEDEYYDRKRELYVKEEKKKKVTALLHKQLRNAQAFNVKREREYNDRKRELYDKEQKKKKVTASLAKQLRKAQAFDVEDSPFYSREGELDRLLKETHQRNEKHKTQRLKSENSKHSNISGFESVGPSDKKGQERRNRKTKKSRKETSLKSTTKRKSLRTTTTQSSLEVFRNEDKEATKQKDPLGLSQLFNFKSYYKNWRRQMGTQQNQLTVETFGFVNIQACKLLVEKAMPSLYDISKTNDVVCYASGDRYINDDDSGAPAIRHGALVAVTVGGAECDGDHVAIGMKMSCYCSWIADNLPSGGKDMNCCNNCCDVTHRAETKSERRHKFKNKYL